MEYSAEVEIKAPIERVWEILTTASNYPDWNPTVTKLEGTIALNEKITVHAKISPDRAFPVKVSEFQPSSRMVWEGGMPLGLFKGVRTFGLEEADGVVKFTMTEVFSGPMVGMISKSMPDLSASFTEFAESLKKEAEKK